MTRIISHQRKLRSMNSVEVNPYFKTMYCFCAIFCIQRLVGASILPFLPNFDRHQHVPYFVSWCRHSRSYDFYELILEVPALKVTIWKMVPVRLTYNNYDKRNTCVGNKEKFEDAKEISRSVNQRRTDNAMTTGTNRVVCPIYGFWLPLWYLQLFLIRIT